MRTNVFFSPEGGRMPASLREKGLPGIREWEDQTEGVWNLWADVEIVEGKLEIPEQKWSTTRFYYPNTGFDYDAPPVFGELLPPGDWQIDLIGGGPVFVVTPAQETLTPSHGVSYAYVTGFEPAKNRVFEFVVPEIVVQAGPERYPLLPIFRIEEAEAIMGTYPNSDWPTYYYLPEMVLEPPKKRLFPYKRNGRWYIFRKEE